jgi:hypothetical protein
MSEPVIKVPFDVPTLVEHLNSNEPMAIVIRGHLYIEAALIHLLEAAMVDTSAIKTARLTFSTKLKWAVALGKLDTSDAGGLAAFDGMRNRFAHDLKTELNDKDESDRHNALSAGQRKLVDLHRKDELPLIGRLRSDIIGLVSKLYQA